MPLLNDKTCKTCDQELKWVGSIIDGKLECTNPFCKEKFDFAKLDYGSGISLAGDFEQDVAVKDSCTLANLSPDRSAKYVRYLNEVPNGHRKWCYMHPDRLTKGISICDCGHTAPSPYSPSTIVDLEDCNYGPVP